MAILPCRGLGDSSLLLLPPLASGLLFFPSLEYAIYRLIKHGQRSVWNTNHVGVFELLFIVIISIEMLD